MAGVMLAACSACMSSQRHEQRSETSPRVVVGGMQARPEVVHGPGTPLPDGFVVEKGTWRIGPVRPGGIAMLYKGVPIPDDGWKAEFAVDASPAVVLRAYVAQALRRGYRFHPSPEVGDRRLAAEFAEACHSIDRRTRCEMSMAAGSRKSGHGIQIEYFRLPPERSVDVAGTHLTIAMSRLRPVPPAYDPQPDKSPLTRSIPRLNRGAKRQPTIPMRALADIGQPVFPSATGEIKALRIEPGSELVASPWPLDANQPSYGLLLRITGNADQVARRYARQIGQLAPVHDTAGVHEGRAGGRGARLLTVMASEAGGASYILTIVDGGIEDRWGWFETSYD